MKSRAAAAGALGRYVFAGEIEEISAQELREIEDLLLEVLNSDQPKVVRRYALEALGFLQPGGGEAIYRKGLPITG